MTIDGEAFDAKLRTLNERLRELPGAVVAFSGGVDSTMLLHAAAAALGSDRVLAITAVSPSLPAAERAEAEAIAASIGVRHELLHTAEIEREGYVRNAGDRCYFCKTELFETIARELRQAAAESSWPVLYGAIADDLADHRPGGRAAAEHGVLAPLADSGWTKADVRDYSRAHGLPTAEKPAFACLASRVPYGTRIDTGVLSSIERAEDALRRLGFRQFRVRHHGDVARIEVAPDELEAAFAARDVLRRDVRAAGYAFVALDLDGYRTGALNEVL